MILSLKYQITLPKKDLTLINVSFLAIIRFYYLSNRLRLTVRFPFNKFKPKSILIQVIFHSINSYQNYFLLDHLQSINSFPTNLSSLYFIILSVLFPTQLISF